MQPKYILSRHSIERLECRMLLSAAAGLVADGLTHSQLLSLYASGKSELHAGGKSNPLGIVSTNLRNLYASDPSGVGITTAQFGSIQSSNGNPAVAVRVRGNALVVLRRLEKLGLSVIAVNAHSHLVDGYLPLSSLVMAAKVKGVAAITALSKATVHSVGSAVDQADSVENVATARNQFSVNGTGVKIGVISDSVNQVGGGLSDSVASGDLPNNVVVLKDGQVGDTDEGRAMLEEIHDLAPGASLYFYSGDNSQDVMATAINALRISGCKIIVDDLGYPGEPMFQDGVVSKAINTFVATGGTYFSAIGNDGNSGYLHTNTQYTTTNGITYVNWAGNGTVAGETLSFNTSGPIDINFQWDNPFNGDTGSATTDLNVYIYQNNNLITSSTDQNLSSGIPQELLSTLQPGNYQMQVQVAAMSPGAILPDMIKFVGSEDATGGLTAIQYNNGIRSSGFGHAVGGNTISVGAVEFASAPPFSSITPIKNETFSSTGPVIYAFDQNGARLSSPLTLNKPDVSGIDGVNTSFFGSVAADDPTMLPQFYGTSAAAPNVAAIAALIDQAHPGATEAQILAALKSSATPLNGAAAGAFDSQGGYGLVDAPKALAYFGALPVAPTVQLAAVTTPRTTPVSSEAITFNEAVTGFSLADLSLTLNGGANLLTGSQTLTSSNQTNFTLGNLASLTSTPGVYTLTLSPDAITGQGLSLANGASVSWTSQAPTAPTVSLTQVFSPRTTSISTEAITFNEAVVGFTLANLSLTLNGGANLLTSNQTLTSSNQTVFSLNNLSAITSAGGTYTLTLNPAGITGNGIGLAAGGSVNWQNNPTTAQPTVALTPITTPRATAVASETITFNVPVTGLTVSSFTLSRDLGANLITSAVTLTKTGATTYVLGNLSALTSTMGSYVLTLDPTGISGTGGSLANGATISWQMTVTIPLPPTVVLTPVTTPRLTSIASETITFDKAVVGFTLAKLTLTRNGGANLLTSAQTLTSSNQITFTLANLASITAAPGTYKLTLSPAGISSGGTAMTTGASITWVVNSQAVAPTVTLGAITSPRATAVSSETITFSEAVAGFTLARLTLTRNGGANLLTSAQTLASSNQIAFTLNNLAALTSTPGTYVLTLSKTGITGSGLPLTSGASVTWTTTATAHATIVGRHLFYNDSSFDGSNSAANAADDKAIATNKTALLPGQTATYANISNFARGINGVMIDVAGLPAAQLTAADFTFKTGNVNATSTWAAGPKPLDILVRPGAGVNGSTRVEITWSDHSSDPASAVGKKWLQVTVKAGVNTGLAANDVFYFGSAIGDTGLSTTSAAVTSADVAAIKAHESTVKVPVTSNFDINRDGVVTSADAALAQSNETSGASVLALIKPV